MKMSKIVLSLLLLICLVGCDQRPQNEKAPAEDASAAPQEIAWDGTQNLPFDGTAADWEVEVFAETSTARAESPAEKKISDFAGKRIGAVGGTKFDSLAREKIPRVIIEYLNSYSDEILAIATKRLDGFVVDEPDGVLILQENPQLAMTADHLIIDEYAFAFAPQSKKLLGEFNTVLAELEKSGELARLQQKWIYGDEKEKIITDYATAGNNGTLNLTIEAETPPWGYLKQGKFVGYEVEIANRVAQKYGYKLEVHSLDFLSILTGLALGKYEVAACGIAISEDRKQKVNFSTPHYRGGVRIVYPRDNANADGAENPHARAEISGGIFAKLQNIWHSLEKSIERTLLVEHRWKLILNGLFITIIIAVAAAIVGTLLGFGICLMRRSNSWAVVWGTQLLISVVQGTPMVVLLMMLYYVVFSSVNINAVYVAIIGFALNFAVYVAEMMRSGVETLDKGQLEAATALGFNRYQVFRYIIFPQAARIILPVYKGEFISMLKMTAVVGYIAIQDLTKMSDIIRSRTYEAFFPLILTALIYLLVAYFFVWLLSLIEIRIDPKRRARKI